MSATFALIALAVLIDSRGPIFFRQPRYGKDGKIIMVTKFRTMKRDKADIGGARQASRGDDRVTRIGRFLRSTCLDELPQLWDVLRGRLSLVGPRPHPVEMLIEGVRADEAVNGYHARHAVRPGITGLAQVKGNRGPVTSIAMGEERIALDCAYIDRISFMTDLRILLATASVPFRRGVNY